VLSISLQTFRLPQSAAANAHPLVHAASPRLHHTKLAAGRPKLYLLFSIVVDCVISTPRFDHKHRDGSSARQEGSSRTRPGLALVSWGSSHKAISTLADTVHQADSAREERLLHMRLVGIESTLVLSAPSRRISSYVNARPKLRFRHGHNRAEARMQSWRHAASE
jgi:hypothetical protein